MPALTPPTVDPTPLFEHFRGNYGTELLTAAVAHFQLFSRLAQQPLSRRTLGQQLGLAERPTVVLTTALLAMGLLEQRGKDLHLAPQAREHLLPGGELDVGDYIGLAANSPGVREMVERLRTNQPANLGSAEGTAYIYRDGMASAMDQAASARHFTMALAGRAKNVAPVLAERLDLATSTHLLDLGGGTGIYSIALLQKYPGLRASVLDRPEVLKITADLARDYGVQDRLTCVPGDMFREPLPACDAVLLSNVLHDWDVPECQALLRRASGVLAPGGKLILHDVFLNDALDGPLPIALYSAALFTLTEGRAYSAAEYTTWLRELGLQPQPVQSTLIHCGALVAVKP